MDAETTTATARAVFTVMETMTVWICVAMIFVTLITSISAAHGGMDWLVEIVRILMERRSRNDR